MAELTFSDVLARHAPVLVLDTAGTAQAVWAEGGPGAMRSARVQGEAGTALFAAVRALAAPESTSQLIAAAGAFVFCSGPGSVLGIRTAALALRLWTGIRARPVFSYQALELLAAASGPGVAHIADARRGQWHWQVAGEPPARVPEGELQARADALGAALSTPEGFRAWGRAPASVTVTPYDVAALLSATRTLPLLRATAAPDAVLPAESEYVRWTPRLHSSSN